MDDFKNDEEICLLASFSAKLIFIDREEVVLEPDQKKDLNATGACMKDSQTAYLELQWKGYEDRINRLGINFSSSGQKDHKIVKVDRISTELNEDKNLLNFKLLFDNRTQLEGFDIKQKYSYKCKHGAIKIAYNETITLELTNVHWEVFRDRDDKKAKDPEFLNVAVKCDSDVEMSKSAPFIAGIVMLCLVIVVVGFLVFGRMRYRKVPSDKY